MLRALLKLFKRDQTWGFTERMSDFHQAVTLAFVPTSDYHGPPRVLKVTVALDLTCKEQACVCLFSSLLTLSAVQSSAWIQYAYENDTEV